MKLGGHETFAPRAGWLTKGMMALAETPGMSFSDPHTADALGVGRNMAKAIGWWLSTLGVAERETRHGPLRISAFGDAIRKADPYLERTDTLWMLHVGALVSSESAIPWFFETAPRRFVATDMTQRLLAATGRVKGRAPTVRAAQREVAVLLAAYARPVPGGRGDPEDAARSPLHRIGLMQRHLDGGGCTRTAPVPMPPEALGMLVNAAVARDDDYVDLPVAGRTAALLGLRTGMEPGALFAIAEQGRAAKGWLTAETLAGERVIRARRAAPEVWAAQLFGPMKEAA